MAAHGRKRSDRGLTIRLPQLSSTRSASSEANLSLYSTLGFILFVVLSVVPLRTVNRWLGQFIDKLVAASDPLNNDRKWRRRVDLWLPDKIFRQPGAGPGITGLSRCDRCVNDLIPRVQSDAIEQAATRGTRLESLGPRGCETADRRETLRSSISRLIECVAPALHAGLKGKVVVSQLLLGDRQLLS